MSIQSGAAGRRVFAVVNAVFLLVLAVVCFAPFVHVIVISLSSRQAVETGRVTLWPVEPTLRSYAFIAEKPIFLQTLLVSVKRVLLGSALNMALTFLVAYPLSKQARAFRLRSVYLWFFIVTMLFGGGMIPLYMIVVKTMLVDTIWALVLPVSVPVFNIILLMNFFRDIPRELEEAAFMDGAGHWRTLAQIYIPLSLPAIATLTLFVVVFHWNSWFDGVIFMRTPEHQPLQTYIAGLVRSRGIVGGRRLTLQELKALAAVSERTAQAAQILLASLPIILVYPLLQRYFVKGIMLGSVKG
jgi:putative aldouronate transport system permease protein